MELDALGLTADEGRMYVALVGRPRETAADLAAACGLSPGLAGRVLARLVARGLATRTPGRPPRFLAAAPDVAVTALINQRENELGRARSFVHELMEMHREAARITRPDTAVEVITGAGDISAMTRGLHKDAQERIRAFDRPPYVDRPGDNLGVQVERQRQGVAYRVVYDRAAVAWPGRMRRDIGPSVRAGEKARVRPALPLKLLLCDDAVGIIPFSLAPGGLSAAYVIHRSPLLVALAALFEAEWERGVPLPAAATGGRGPSSGPSSGPSNGPRHGTPNGQTRGTSDGPADGPAYGRGPDGAAGPEPDEEMLDLLALLAGGLTDAAIARSLGWSARTTQRRIHRLMQALGASTRMQAGLVAARRGWI